MKCVAIGIMAGVVALFLFVVSVQLMVDSVCDRAVESFSGEVAAVSGAQDSGVKYEWEPFRTEEEVRNILRFVRDLEARREAGQKR